MTQTTGYVQTKSNAGVAAIHFFHPRGNSLPGQLLQDLAAHIKKAGEDPEVKVIVLRTEGEKVFCAGASFDELSAITTAEAGKKFFMGFAHVINAMRTCPKFIIGRVQGKCVGGGVGLAAAVDYCLATENADIKLSELAVGIGPFVVGPAVERKIGVSAFSQLAIDASSWRSAAWAKEKGLYAGTYATTPELDEALEQLVMTLKSSHPQAMRDMKKIFWQGTDHWDQLLEERAGISGQLVLSDFCKQAIASFKLKA